MTSTEESLRVEREGILVLILPRMEWSWGGPEQLGVPDQKLGGLGHP